MIGDERPVHSLAHGLSRPERLGVEGGLAPPGSGNGAPDHSLAHGASLSQRLGGEVGWGLRGWGTVAGGGSFFGGRGCCEVFVATVSELR